MSYLSSATKRQRQQQQKVISNSVRNVLTVANNDQKGKAGQQSIVVSRIGKQQLKRLEITCVENRHQVRLYAIRYSRMRASSKRSMCS